MVIIVAKDKKYAYTYYFKRKGIRYLLCLLSLKLRRKEIGIIKEKEMK